MGLKGAKESFFSVERYVDEFLARNGKVPSSRAKEKSEQVEVDTPESEGVFTQQIGYLMQKRKKPRLGV